ncbi:conjugal transfer protein MobC [Porphyromonas levii]|uniref:conjugal transfer protein MobC n=1 Tax=Porphyromonas levii TaxID=28114 RepID=UPI000377972B|nr:conjugal transfer protein MobC [Porphyromonas levii]
MGQEDDLRALGKIMDFMKGLGIFILILHIYFYCWSAFHELGLTYPVINTVLMRLSQKTMLFSSPLFSKLLALVFLALGVLGIRGVKNEKITWSMVALAMLGGTIFYFGNFGLLDIRLPLPIGKLMIYRFVLYSITLAIGTALYILGLSWIRMLMDNNLMDDVFNIENESFMQETRLITNEDSVNLPTRFYYNKTWNDGWINVISPYRATMVLGTPGSGKSFAVVNNYIKQFIEKGFAMYVYDFKFPDLSIIAYNHLANHLDKYGDTKPKFYIINIDDPRRSHRCNPLSPRFMTDISDAYESAYTIMLNLNKTWIQKQGDFFVESPITLLTAIIWFLKIYDEGKYCTFPHAIELLNANYETVFNILMDYDELENYMAPFMDAFRGNAQDQLQGQLASAKIPLARMISPALYWVMSGDDFTLDLNNPKDPKVLVVGNNPDRQNIYSAALGLYNARIVKLINKKRINFEGENGEIESVRTMKSSVIIDELPTIYFRGLDNLINTARSNRVAVCLGFQDFSQLTRDYGDKEAKVIQNTVANLFSGQVTGDTAETISKRFGKVLQKRTSKSINRNDTSTSISTQMESLIPASKISTLTQGTFVGVVADDINQPIEQKIFHSHIIVDVKKVKEEESKYIKEMPILLDYKGVPLTDDEADGVLRANYNRIKEEVRAIVALESDRIKKKQEAQQGTEA